jgi:uncharacterized protein
MLTHTFCHVPGLGVGTEKRLWSVGVRTWRDAISARSLPLSAARAASLQTCLDESTAQLKAGNVRYFAERLPPREHWRLFPHFRNSLAYLDIETTGLGNPGDSITTIVVYDGARVRSYVQGRNLPDFAADIARYDLLVTYNGKSFDLPFIRRYLGPPVDQAHIDLRHVLASLGLKGGLKGCERQLGLTRGDLEEVDGFFAVLLWQAHCRSGDERVLETLLAYNALDVINLEELMVEAYNRKTAALDRAELKLAAPDLPANPFHASAEIIRAVRRSAGWI